MPVTVGDDGGQEFGDFALVGIQRAVKCLLSEMNVTDDMLVVGPLERDLRRLFLPVATDGRATDIEEGDQVTIRDGEGNDIIWVVEEPVDPNSFRGVANHIEALVVRKVMQE